MQKEDLQSETARKTLLYAARKLLGRVDKIKAGQDPATIKLIDDERSISFRKTLQEIINAIEEVDRQVEIRRREKTLLLDCKKVDNTQEKANRCKDPCWITQSVYHVQEAPLLSHLPKFHTISRENISQVLASISEEYKQLQKMQRSSSKIVRKRRLACNISLSHIIDQLSIPSVQTGSIHYDFLQGVPLQEMIVLSKELTLLLSKYIENGVAGERSSRRFANLFTIYSIIHVLSVKIGENRGLTGNAL